MKQTVLHKRRDDELQDFATGRESILRTIAYFDIFNYPLTCDEIQQFLISTLPTEKLHELLEELTADNTIYLHHGFYSLQNNLLLVHRRRQGNLRATKLLDEAAGIGRFLFQFPFVRSVGISGSLSKNFADEKADVDFFIITKANRLWIARTIMHLYKKLTYLSGRQHYYCMNYYVDEEALELMERNIYTAIELKTLLPLNGEPAMQQLFLHNQWADEWFPQCAFRQQGQPETKAGIVKRLAEGLFNNRLGNWLDGNLQKITSRRWKRKEARGKTNGNGLVMELVTNKHFAYSNSGSFREKVLTLYKKKLQGLGIE